MKKWYAVPVFLLAMLFALPASAQSPCWGICQAYYPCDYPCDLCEGDPGLWEGSYCWGEIRSTTCGEIGQCGYVPCEPNWVHDEWATFQGVRPEFDYDPRCEWVGQNYVCDYANPYKCTVNGVFRFVRHQDNCPYQTSSETFCLINNNGQPPTGWYPGYWPDQCCWDSNQYGCSTYFPQCPNL